MNLKLMTTAFKPWSSKTLTWLSNRSTSRSWSTTLVSSIRSLTTSSWPLWPLRLVLSSQPFQLTKVTLRFTCRRRPLFKSPLLRVSSGQRSKPIHPRIKREVLQPNRLIDLIQLSRPNLTSLVRRVLPNTLSSSSKSTHLTLLRSDLRRWTSKRWSGYLRRSIASRWTKSQSIKRVARQVLKACQLKTCSKPLLNTCLLSTSPRLKLIR